MSPKEEEEVGFKNYVVDQLLAFINYSLNILNSYYQIIIKIKIIEKFSPIVNVETQTQNILFYCPGRLLAFRANSLLTKEPETINWIDSFEQDDIMWDVGANIGCYTLYAASKGISVCAFEPVAANYYILNKNINLNQFCDVVNAYCLAFSDGRSVDFLNLTTTDLGGALCMFGNKTENVKLADVKKRVISRQGMLGYSIDDFICQFNFAIPTSNS